MIKFFRKIRQQLMAENKVTKYFLYAFGEVVLVVIGILIALLINSWYTDIQQRKIEKKYLTEIRNNLLSDLVDIDFNLNFNKARLKSNKVVLQFLNREIPYSDSLTFHLANIMYTTRTLANTSAYENVKSRGLEIISNDSLRQTITKLYSFHFHNAIDFETQDDHALQYGVVIPEAMKALNIIVPWQKAEPINREQLLSNYSFKNAVSSNIHLREYMLNTYRALKRNVEKCIRQIDRELETFE